MAAKRVFISFDYDHDEDLRNLLAGQAKNPDSPFSIQDWSVKDPIPGDWKAKVRSRIRRTDLTIVLCGEHTHTASGVSVELDITKEERHECFLLRGHPNKPCTKPRSATPSDKMYTWTWENLKKLIGGAR